MKKREQLKIMNISKHHGAKHVLKDVSITVKMGESVGLLGPNGAGKTTLFHIICGFIPSERGEIFLEDKDVKHLKIHKRAKHGIVYLPQEASIFRKLTVKENLLAILENRRDLTGRQRNEKAEELMEEMNLTAISKQLGYTLSGGERRRTEIARALAMNPKFLLLDEPFAATDPKSVHEIRNIIVRLVRDKGLGVLITDHNERATLDATTYVYIIYDGKIMVSGHPSQLVDNEIANKYYFHYSMTDDGDN